jgi:thioredoxin-related protein
MKREMVGAGIGPDRLVADIPLAKLGVTGTPTLLFIDRTGKIVKAWVGEVPSEYQRDVIAELR